MSDVITKVELDPGRYYVGDPCYALSDEQYDELLEFGYDRALSWQIGGTGPRAVRFVTQYGDGTYGDQAGRVYGVDSGNLACIPAEACERRLQASDYWDVRGDELYSGHGVLCGHFVEFDAPIKCWRTDDGTLVFGPLVIETGD